MNKEKKALKAEKKQAKVRKRHEKLREAGSFKRWRKRRPFWGATLTLLAGLLILWIPIHLYFLAFAPGNFAIVGLLFGGLITIIGVMAYFYPQFSTVFGVMTLFLSVISIMGALGGFVVGTILGIVGGSFCIAWSREVVPARQKADNSNVREFRKTGTEGKPSEKAEYQKESVSASSARVLYVDENNEIASGLEPDSTSGKDMDAKDTRRSVDGPLPKTVNAEEVMEAVGSNRNPYKKDMNKKRNA